MGSGRGEASHHWTRNDDGRRRVDLKDSGEEGSPCWSRLEMDMCRCLDRGCGSIVPLRCGPGRETTEQDASSCSLDWHIVWA